MTVAWEHQLLDRHVTQHANFAGYSGLGFNTRNTVTGADALNVTPGLNYTRNDRLSIGASVSSDFMRSGHRSVAGNLSLSWKF